MLLLLKLFLLELTLTTAVTRSLSSLMVAVTTAADRALRSTTERVLLADLLPKSLPHPPVLTITVTQTSAMSATMDSSLPPLVIWLWLQPSLKPLLQLCFNTTVLAVHAEKAFLTASVTSRETKHMSLLRMKGLLLLLLKAFLLRFRSGVHLTLKETIGLHRLPILLNPAQLILLVAQQEESHAYLLLTLDPRSFVLMDTTSHPLLLHPMLITTSLMHPLLQMITLEWSA